MKRANPHQASPDKNPDEEDFSAGQSKDPEAHQICNSTKAIAS